MARLLASAVALVAAVLAAGGGEGPDLPADAAGICATVATRFEEIQAEPPRSFDEAEQQLEAMIEIAAAADAAAGARRLRPGGVRALPGGTRRGHRSTPVSGSRRSGPRIRPPTGRPGRRPTGAPSAAGGWLRGRLPECAERTGLS